MHQGLIKRSYSLDRHTVCKELLAETIGCCMLQKFGRILAVESGISLFIGLNHYVLGCHADAEFRQVTKTGQLTTYLTHYLVPSRLLEQSYPIKSLTKNILMDMAVSNI